MATAAVSGLEVRAATLEVELRHARQQTEISAQGARFLLQLSSYGQDLDRGERRQLNCRIEDLQADKRMLSYKLQKLQFEYVLLTGKYEDLWSKKLELYERFRIHQLEMRTHQEHLKVFKASHQNLVESHKRLQLENESLKAQIVYSQPLTTLSRSEPGEFHDVSRADRVRSQAPARSTKPENIPLIDLDDGISSEFVYKSLRPPVGLCAMTEGVEEWHGQSGQQKDLEHRSISTVRKTPPRQPGPASSHIQCLPRDPFWACDRDEGWIRYKPAVGDDNQSYQVTVSNLPSNITYRQIFDGIFGGTVNSVQILDTARICGSWTALIRFLEARSAKYFCDCAKTQPLIFHDQGSVREAHVRLIETATFPMSPYQRERIKQGGQTRCLRICNPSPSLTAVTLENLASLQQDLSRLPGDEVIAETRDESNGILYLAFTSIEAAASAIVKLSRNINPKLTISFARDSCDREVANTEQTTNRIHEVARNPDEIIVPDSLLDSGTPTPTPTTSTE